MKKQILALVSLFILSTPTLAQASDSENPLLCNKQQAPIVLSAYLKSLKEQHPTTESALESGGQKLKAKLTPVLGDDVPAKTNLELVKIEQFVLLAHCYNILWGQGELKPDFKAQLDKKKKMITDNDEYLSLGYPSLEDATSEDDKHHAQVRQLVMANIDAIAFVLAFFDGSKYLEMKSN